MSFPGFPRWFWSGRSKEERRVSNGSSLNSLKSASSDWGLGLMESETVKSQSKITPAKGKWQGSEDTRLVDKEYDFVMVVPSDGVHLSGYESDGPELSIGWEEPPGPGFHDDGGFAVLVRCYRLGCKELVEDPNNQLLSAIKKLPNGFFSAYICLQVYLELLGSMHPDDIANIVNRSSQLTIQVTSFRRHGRDPTLYSSGSLLFRTCESPEMPDRVTIDEVSANISAGVLLKK